MTNADVERIADAIATKVGHKCNFTPEEVKEIKEDLPFIRRYRIAAEEAGTTVRKILIMALIFGIIALADDIKNMVSTWLS